MPLPEPQRGLVISYSYLWHHEHRAGRDEGRKNRPCVIVVAAESDKDGAIIIRVVPVTHTPPDNSAAGIELPAVVKRHLGLDDQRSWVILDEINEFVWPGFDLRPVSEAGDRFDYGLIPPRLFAQIMTQMRRVWTAGQGRVTARD